MNYRISCSAGLGTLYLLERPVRDFVDETSNGVFLRHERTGLDAGDTLANISFEVAEGFQGKRGADTGLLGDLSFDVVIREGEHAAVGVVDEDYFLCSQ